MTIIERILSLPGAYYWLPGMVFLVIAVAIYGLTRRATAPVAEAEAVAPTVQIATAPKKSQEQRIAFRRHGNPVEVFVATPEDKEERAVGSVLDRSVGGMRLALYHEVAIGTVVSIRPTHADDIVPWIDLEIRSCRPSSDLPGQYDVGCQYVKSPPYSIQLLFG